MTNIKEIVVSTLDFDKFKLVNKESGEVVNFSLKQELSIDKNMYQKDFIDQPAKYVYWQAILQSLKTYMESVIRLADKQHAHMYNYAYNQLKDGSRRPTKDQVESFILDQDSYQKSLEKVEKAKESVGIVNAIVKAFEQRKDMLIQLGADERQNRNNSN